MARLWKDFGGEPFLINPHLAIVGNPKKGKKKGMTRRKSRGRKNTPRRRHRRTSNPRRRRAYRRNSFSVPGVALAANPRRRRRGRKNSPRRHHRKGYRRNPAVLGMHLPALQTVAYVGVGFVGTPILEGFLSSFLPTTFATTTIGKYVARIGAMLGVTWLSRAVVGQGPSNLVAIGGGLYIVTSAIKDFAPGIIPGLGYTPAGLAAYQNRLTAYQNRLQGGLRQYRGLAAPDFGAQQTAHAAPQGGMNIVASRYRRLQGRGY